MTGVADRDPGSYNDSTSEGSAIPAVNRDAGGDVGGTTSAPASSVRAPAHGPVAPSLPMPGLALCAHVLCRKPFVQAKTGRKRRTCSDRCRKRIQLDQRYARAGKKANL